MEVEDNLETSEKWQYEWDKNAWCGRTLFNLLIFM